MMSNRWIACFYHRDSSRFLFHFLFTFCSFPFLCLPTLHVSLLNHKFSTTTSPSQASIAIGGASVTKSLSVEYDRIYSDPHDYTRYAYATNIEPLVRESIAGESTMAVIGGVTTDPLDSRGEVPNTPVGKHYDSAAAKTNHFLHSHTVLQSLVCQAAGQLLNAVHFEGTKVGSLFGSTVVSVRKFLSFSHQFSTTLTFLYLFSTLSLLSLFYFAHLTLYVTFSSLHTFYFTHSLAHSLTLSRTFLTGRRGHFQLVSDRRACSRGHHRRAEERFSDCQQPR